MAPACSQRSFNGDTVKTVFSGQRSNGVRIVSSPHFTDLIIRKLCGGVGLPSWPSLSFDAVRSIIHRVSPSEVFRIAARRIVAGVKAPSLRPVLRKHQRHTVGVQMIFYAKHIKGNLAVSLFRGSHFPRPAIIPTGDVNMLPKASLLFVGNMRDIEKSHGVSPHVCGQGRQTMGVVCRPVHSSVTGTCQVADMAMLCGN
jgi:hypothetical protein